MRTSRLVVSFSLSLHPSLWHPARPSASPPAHSSARLLFSLTCSPQSPAHPFNRFSSCTLIRHLPLPREQPCVEVARACLLEVARALPLEVAPVHPLKQLSSRRHTRSNHFKDWSSTLYPVRSRRLRSARPLDATHPYHLPLFPLDAIQARRRVFVIPDTLTHTYHLSYSAPFDTGPALKPACARVLLELTHLP